MAAWAGLAWLGLGDDRRHLDPPPRNGARIEMLDVGQGDAILVRPGRGDPVLVDGGPAGGDLIGALESADVERLAAAVLTHPDADHVDGLYDLLGRIDVGRLLFDAAPSRLLALARAEGVARQRVAAGTRLDLGRLEMEVLWPPPRVEGQAPAGEPNDRSVVTLLSLGRFRMLLTGDAEAETVPLHPGDIDVLKVAHHGSDDAGLPALLTEADPELALISVGSGNRFGHPTPATLSALTATGTPIRRTDRDGTVSIVIDGGGYRMETGR